MALGDGVGGIRWGTNSHDTSGAQAPCLEMKHEYWEQSKIGSGHTYIVANVTVKNTGATQLNDIQVRVNPDDNSPVLDAVLVDSGGTELANQTVTLSFGNLAPGQQSGKQKYWWSLRVVIPDVPPDAFQATFNLSPKFTVEYGAVGIFSDVSQVAK